jgi:O-acetylhomoserine (thiol)-lyase
MYLRTAPRRPEDSDLTEGGNIYTRIMNPTSDVFRAAHTPLWKAGSAALAVSSGSAARAYAVQNIAHAGDHIVAAKTIYGGPITCSPIPWRILES